MEILSLLRTKTRIDMEQEDKCEGCVMAEFCLGTFCEYDK